jgi:hypothetical protein
VAVAVTVGGSALLGAGTAAAVDIRPVTDRYLFRTSLSGFESVRAQAPYAGQLDWSSDGCSWSPDKPFGFEFLPGCHRHDFGYRNYKRQGRFDETARKRIDDNLYADLKSACGSNVACKATAWTYYKAVREFGG